MATSLRPFVQLGRTFHALAKSARASDDIDHYQGYVTGPQLTWTALLKEYRVVILSEAGTGKTNEIRQVARDLRAAGNQAFFLRLEEIASGLEDAFERETGTFDQFKSWLASTDEGWLLLDSVDEARLRNPADFASAIRKLGRHIDGASDRVHIILTGRTGAWRPRSDLELCETHLPFTPVLKAASDSDDVATLGDDIDDIGAIEIDNSSAEEFGEEAEASSPFLIVTLDDLSAAQVEAFAGARGVSDTQALMDEIERTDSSSFTGRPQDLEELVDYWKKHRRIGTRLEMMRNSIERRLSERDQNQREAHPLSVERARAGARLLAAAAVLGKEPAIQVPDGSHNGRGLAVQLVLPDWDAREQATLLVRPIFDEAIYGAVRFHHRSVREFLTAEWLSLLLEKSASRREVEALLFRVQYDREVVIPTMRPVLPWLCIMDERIRNKVLQLAPEILFEGGDPTALPIETRRAMLTQVCSELASGQSGGGALDYAAVQRFASPEMADDIRTLLATHADHSETVNFLARMIWLGRLKELRPEAKALALSPAASYYTRRAAIRALQVVGKDEDVEQLREAFLGEAEELERGLLSEIVDASTSTRGTVAWLMSALEKTQPKERHSTDPLAGKVNSFVERTPLELLPALVEGFDHLLAEPPYIERGYCDVSNKHAWLLGPGATAVERLIQERHAEALRDPSLGILHKLQATRNWETDLRDIKIEFGKLVPTWPELNRAAFWFDVAATRQSERYLNRDWRLTGYWQASILGASWSFDTTDFDFAAHSIAERPFQDDKLVALTLAFDLYVTGNRLKAWCDRLMDLVAGNDELEERLNALLNPVPAEHDKEESKWKKRQAAEEKRAREDKEKSRLYIRSHVELVRDPKFDKPYDISRTQWYLHEYLREKVDHSSRWTVGKWRELAPDFGEDVAQAYREAVTSYWRKYRPMLRSEGAPQNSTPHHVIFGLAGLDIEAAETAGWPLGLSEEEVLLACRYAAYELNGFPPWFPKLFVAFPTTVAAFLLQQIESEVQTVAPEQDSLGLLSDVTWSGQWAWQRLAPALMELLRASDVVNPFVLNKLLTIVNGSEGLADVELADLARAKSASSSNPEIAATWFTIWVGVEPEAAIEAVTRHLVRINDAEQQTRFAMMFVTGLFRGSRSEPYHTRQRFSTPAHLQTLYMLMQTYVREEDDIEHESGTAYSPDLRDHAQEARSALYNRLREIPGKEAFVALSEIAATHPNAPSRPWLAKHALEKAQKDADLSAWTPVQMRDFYEHLDRTPGTHRELADLAIMRLLDLKDDLENGDDSVARILQRVEQEPEMRNFMAHELRGKAQGRFTVTQEEELADEKRPDLRFHGAGFDAPVPTELKLAERWSGPSLIERLENQLSGDYLRDNRSARGVFALVNRKAGRHWDMPSGQRVDFDGLLVALRNHWTIIAPKHTRVEDLSVIGIDLSKRFLPEAKPETKPKATTLANEERLFHISLGRVAFALMPPLYIISVEHFLVLPIERATRQNRE